MADSARQSLAGVVVMSGDHEPLIFRRRRGSARLDEEARYLQSHSPEAVKKLADSGVNWFRMHFFKGFGLKHEREEIDLAKRMVELCHDNGIRVELYTQFGTLQYETFKDEVPDVRDWVQIDDLGRPITITYGHQGFRWMPCAAREGYWRYLQEVVRIGIEDVGGDGIGFDNIALGTEPESCRCPQCREGFVRFLKERYRTDTADGRARAKERFGFDVMDHIEPPAWNRWCQPVDYRVIIDPVVQEWVEFRCESLRSRFEEMHRHIRSLSQDVVIEYNVYPPWGTNSAFWHGIDMLRLIEHVDAFWNERDYGCEYTDDRRLLHRTHAYKLARAAGKYAFTSHQGRSAEHRRLAAAESLTFNRGLLGGGTAAMGELVEFRRSHAELFAGRPLAEVAMFESSRCLARNSVDTHYASILATQALLAGHVPFELYWDECLRGIERYKVLILPDVECVPEEMAALFLEFVHGGGGLVATDRTGYYDGWHRLRPANALTDMLGRFPPLTAGPGGRYGGPQEGPDGKIVRAEVGRGRAAYVPRLQRVRQFGYTQADWRVDCRYWHRPVNWQGFVDEVRWAGGPGLSFRMDAPEWVVGDPQVLPDGSTAVHVLNYEPRGPATNVKVHLSRLGQSATAELYQPGRSVETLGTQAEGDGLSVTVPSLGYYAVVLIRP